MTKIDQLGYAFLLVIVAFLCNILWSGFLYFWPSSPHTTFEQISTKMYQTTPTTFRDKDATTPKSVNDYDGPDQNLKPLCHSH